MLDMSQTRKLREWIRVSVNIGISLVAWLNGDLPELTPAFPTEGAMEDTAKIGYAGVERGRTMPADTEGLGAADTAIIHGSATGYAFRTNQNTALSLNGIAP